MSWSLQNRRREFLISIKWRTCRTRGKTLSAIATEQRVKLFNDDLIRQSNQIVGCTPRTHTDTHAQRVSEHFEPSLNHCKPQPLGFESLLCLMNLFECWTNCARRAKFTSLYFYAVRSVRVGTVRGHGGSWAHATRRGVGGRGSNSLMCVSFTFTLYSYLRY